MPAVLIHNPSDMKKMVDILSSMNNVPNDQVGHICLTKRNRCYVNGCYALQKFGGLTG